jgi:hypothetical protein
VFTLCVAFDDECEIEKCEEDYIQLFEPGVDAPEAFESAKKPLDLVSFLIPRAVVLP